MNHSLPFLAPLFLVLPLIASGAEPRDFMNSGTPLPHEGYCDQPYVVETKDGTWLCVLTTGRGAEGGPGFTCDVDTAGRDALAAEAALQQR